MTLTAAGPELAISRTIAPLQARELSACHGVAHGFFTRAGGVSGGLYAGLNCGIGSDDATEAVMENRRRVAEHLLAGGAGSRQPNTVYQVHGRAVATLTADLDGAARPQADALVTSQPGVVLGVLTADCGPVLFCDPEAGVIGAAHAGWKGAVGGVLEATLEAMEAIGARRKAICAVLGPTISYPSYEVGDAFMAPIVANDPANAKFFGTPAGKTRPHFDLPAYIVERVRRAGVAKAGAVDMCTYLQPQEFFSYRRATHMGEADYGRQISAIVLR
ncbi:MAG: peptidoglycan editing factor PgeF [Pseudomonadota bacterium]